MGTLRVTRYREFWPFYLRQHRHPTNRLLHFIGTAAGLSCLVLAVATSAWAWLAVAPVVSYGLAWFGHFRFERNQPATFRYPLWSLLSDLRMLQMWLGGRLRDELAKAETQPAAGA